MRPRTFRFTGFPNEARTRPPCSTHHRARDPRPGPCRTPHAAARGPLRPNSMRGSIHLHCVQEMWAGKRVRRPIYFPTSFSPCRTRSPTSSARPNIFQIDTLRLNQKILPTDLENHVFVAKACFTWKKQSQNVLYQICERTRDFQITSESCQVKWKDFLTAVL